MLTVRVLYDSETSRSAMFQLSHSQGLIDVDMWNTQILMTRKKQIKKCSKIKGNTFTAEQQAACGWLINEDEDTQFASTARESGTASRRRKSQCRVKTYSASATSWGALLSALRLLFRVQVNKRRRSTCLSISVRAPRARLHWRSRMNRPCSALLCSVALCCVALRSVFAKRSHLMRLQTCAFTTYALSTHVKFCP